MTLALSLTAALALLVSPAPAGRPQQTRADPARCEAHRVGVANTAKELSWQWGIVSSERSAPRAAVGLAQLELLATMISSKVASMAADGCGGYSGPIGPDAYMDAVQRCRQANGTRTDLTATPSECDRATWQPTSGAL